MKVGNKYEHKDIISRSGLIAFSGGFMVFLTIAAIPFYIIERDIIKKEINNGLYTPLQYLLSSFIISLLGIFCFAISTSLIIMFMSKLNGFGTFFLFILLNLIVGEGIVRLISLIVPHYIIGMAIIACLYGIFMLCQGFIAVKNKIPNYLKWIHYWGFQTYGFEALMYNEFDKIESFNSLIYPTGKDVLIFFQMGNTYLWKNALIIIAWIVGVEIPSQGSTKIMVD